MVSTSSSLRRKTGQGVLCESWPLGVWGQMGQAHDQGLWDTALPLLSCLCSSEDTSGLVFSNSGLGRALALPQVGLEPWYPRMRDKGPHRETRSARVGMAVWRGPETPVGGSVCPSDWEGMACFLFLFGCTRACGILVPQLGIKPGPTAVETWES